ncbi:MAG TPA: peptide chain release factor 2, partial [Erysipelotrichaceae bacterium]|nr:peptide chain release factor 2 [Erysipelotrichaceae bacterium]
GGQHINKTDSAIRMVHKPTGIVATCQSGRSQIQNREEALRILKSRLYQREIEEQEKKIAALKGEQAANEWGSQIRNYVLHPYSLVKDVRTGYETSQVQSVLDGDLDGFIFAYLKSQIQ